MHITWIFLLLFCRLIFKLNFTLLLLLVAIDFLLCKGNKFSVSQGGTEKVLIPKVGLMFRTCVQLKIYITL